MRATPVPVGGLKARVVREATQLFASHGYAATSMREVAEAAGCTKPALYYHFANKEALFLAVLEGAAATVTRIIEEATAVRGPVRERLRVGFEAYFAYVRENPIAIAALMRAEHRADEGQPAFDFRGTREFHRVLTKAALLDGVQTGELRQDLDLDDVVMALVGMVDIRAQAYVLDGLPLPDELPGRLLRIFLEGVSAPVVTTAGDAAR